MLATISDIPLGLISTEDLQTQLSNPALRILDCSIVGQPNDDGSFTFVSQQQEWQNGHIPQSIYVDVPEQLSDQDHDCNLMMPAPKQFMSIMQALGVSDDSLVVLYDRGNHAWATRVWWMFRVCGFDKVLVLNGGWKKWQAEQREQETGNFTFAAANALSYQHRTEFMVNKEQVLAAIGNPEITLLHSLPLPMFTGQVSPYARPGRIPGSHNLFCESLLEPSSHCYLELDVMRQLLSKTGALETAAVIVYCGGGIAASSNAFVLTLLGVKNVAIYDGSLSEWAMDPSLPMETG